jgi:hypothetical protein
LGEDHGNGETENNSTKKSEESAGIGRIIQEAEWIELFGIDAEWFGKAEFEGTPGNV